MEQRGFYDLLLLGLWDHASIIASEGCVDLVIERKGDTLHILWSRHADLSVAFTTYDLPKTR